MLRVKSCQTLPYISLTLVLLAVFCQHLVSGQLEHETAWTEDPPQMTTEKVRLSDVTLKLEKKDLIPTHSFKLQDNPIAENVALDAVSAISRDVAQPVQVDVQQDRVTLKPVPRTDHSHNAADVVQGLTKQYISSSQRKVSHTTNGNGEANHQLKFVSSSANQDLVRHKVNEIGHSNDISQSEVKTEAEIVGVDSSVEGNVPDEINTNKSPSGVEPVSSGDLDIVLQEAQPAAVELEVIDEFPDVSFVKLEELPPTQVIIEHLLEGTVKLVQDSAKSKNPFIEMLKHNKAFLENRLKTHAEDGAEKIAFFNTDVDPKKKPEFIFAEMGLNSVMSPKNNAVSGEEKREKRSVSYTGAFLAPVSQPGVRDNSTKPNGTREQPSPSHEHGKQPSPPHDEELKISRIGYIIFEKNGKIKEAKETSVSELRKVNRTTDKLHKPTRKKLVQTCKHGQYVHPIGQPHEPPSQNVILLPNIGPLVELHGGHNKPNVMTEGKLPGNNFGLNNLGPNNFGPSNLGQNNFVPNNFGPSNLRPNNFGPNNFGQNSFDPNKFGPNSFGQNSIEMLAIPDDSKGLPKKEFSDSYETQAQTNKEKRHYSSYVSAFHMLLIIAICIATFVTILYLSSKYKSEQGRPKRLNSHTALFETNPKYERY